MRTTDTADGQVVNIQKGEYVFREGDPGGPMYLVLDGRVQLILRTQKGESPISTIERGALFGELSMLLSGPRQVSARALTDTQLMPIHHSNCREVFAKYPDLPIRVMQSLAERVSKLNMQVRHLAAFLPDAEESPEVTTGQDNVAVVVNQPRREKPSSDVPEIPESLAQYLWQQEVSCPVCAHKFPVAALRDSKLVRAEKPDTDFRAYYANIEPLWFNIWVCPSCYYAARRQQFGTVADQAIGALVCDEENRVRLWAHPVPFVPNQASAIRAYQLALHCTEATAAPPESSAGLWLALGWLWADAGRKEMERAARQNALNTYRKMYYESRSLTEIEARQKVLYLIGELSRRLGQFEEAKTHLMQVAAMRDGVPYLRDAAQDQLELIKQMKPITAVLETTTPPVAKKK